MSDACPCCNGTRLRERTVNPILSTTRCITCGFTVGQFAIADGTGSGYERITFYFNERSLRRLLERCGSRRKAFYLPMLPVRSAFFRVTIDGSVPKWKAALALPIVAALAAAERIIGRTDSLVIIARRCES